MDIVIKTGFAAVGFDIQFDPQKIIKGKALSESHVRRVEELKGIGTSCLIRCSVIRTTSVTEHPYKVQLELDEKRFVTHASCNCVSGITSKCKHIYALLHYVNTTRSASKTSIEQEWGKPSDAQLGKDIYAKPLVLSDMFECDMCIKKDVEPYHLSYSDVKEIECPLLSVMKFQSMNKNRLLIRKIIADLIIITINQSVYSQLKVCVVMLIILSNDSEAFLPRFNITSDELNKYYENNINMTEQKIEEVCIETVEQSESRKWFQIRKVRISASSKAHDIKTRCKKPCVDLVNRFLEEKSEKHIKSLEYGLKHEREAIEDYVSKYEADVKLIGVFIMPSQPWICVSPDAVVVQDHCVTKILEVKCPFSCKSQPIFDENLKKFNVPYLYYNGNCAFLKASHKYYTQCQMLMYATGLTQCDLYVWSPKGSFLVSVDKDDRFLCDMLPKLQDFYFKYFLPALHNKSEEANKENENINK